MKKSVIKTLFIACGLVFSPNALADDASKEEYHMLSAKGNRACADGDYYSALDFYEKAAKTFYGMTRKGILGAEWDRYRLGTMYKMGKCIRANTQQGTPNYAKVLEWYEKVAYTKPESLTLSKPIFYDMKYDIAEIYFFGKGGVEKNGAKARRLFEEVANIPDKLIIKRADGQYTALAKTRGNGRLMLARMHYWGDFARQDYALAYQWADKGRQDGSDYAAELLAVLRYNGWGTQQNKTEAVILMGDACDMGHSQRACDLYKEMKANRPIRY